MHLIRLSLLIILLTCQQEIWWDSTIVINFLCLINLIFFHAPYNFFTYNNGNAKKWKFTHFLAYVLLKKSIPKIFSKLMTCSLSKIGMLLIGMKSLTLNEYL